VGELASAIMGRALGELLNSNQVTAIMEAHNGLSARIAARAGFPALWASGFSISSAMGLRDANEASLTQAVDVLEWIVDAAGIPVLFDGDSGYGNFNNVRILTRKLSQRGAAGVVLEDKLFPKQNSFRGKDQPLASVPDFCGKLLAALDSRGAAEFQVVARVEALLFGRPLSEALDRAHSYMDAGADAIFLHSRRTDAAEVLAFCQRWQKRGPVIICPTTYPTIPFSTYRETGVAACICANHNLRASFAAMTSASARIIEDFGLGTVEGLVAPMAEVFEMMDYDELENAQARYCGSAGGD